MTLLAKIKRFYLFHGEDEYLKMLKVNDLINSVVNKGFENFDYDYFDGRGLDGAALINAASSPPFGSALRVVLLRNFDKVSPKNQEMIIKFIDSIPEFTSLVMTCGKLDGKDRRKKVYREILQREGHAHEFKELDPKEAFEFLKKRAAELDIEISDEAIEYLIETIGCNIGILNQELVKIAVYAGDEQAISETDVANLIGAGAMGTVFDLPVKIAEGDKEGALKLLHKLLLTRESEGTILFRIKDFFLKLNTVKSANASMWTLVKKFNYTQKAAEILSRLAPGISQESLINCFHHIYESEISLKSARMRKDLVMIDLVARLGIEIKGE